MSEYKSFSRCVVCRSKKNLDAYRGDFEITMLLNTLYLAVMYPLEKRDCLHMKAKKIARYLQEHGIVSTCGNEFQSDDMIRYLRNGLAHFNIEVNSDAAQDKQIRNIKIWAQNLKPKPRCKNPCERPQCIPHQYCEKKDDVNNAICEFTFTIESLKAFTDFIIENVLNTLEDDVCYNCQYREENENGQANR